MSKSIQKHPPQKKKVKLHFSLKKLKTFLEIVKLIKDILG